MQRKQIAGLVLVTLGILALVYGGFSYTQETHDLKLGPLEVEVKDKERIDLPIWLGVATIVVGLAITLVGRRVGS